MKKLVVQVSTNRVGSTVEDEFEIEPDLSEAAIEEIARDMLFEMISRNFEVIDAGEGEDETADD